MNKILLLEDDELFSQTIEDFLEEEGFNIDIAKDGEEALELNYTKNYDLYILDINVPKISGLDLLKELRHSGDNTAAIFLTSYKDKATLDEGFVSGCDDYIKKPVDLNELLHRIKSVLRRCGKQTSLIKLNEQISFNPLTKRVYENNNDINLPVKVILLLELCLENKNNIITKDMIISKLWSASEEYSEGSIRVYVNSLKKLIGKDSVKNIKGVGYKIEF